MSINVSIKANKRTESQKLRDRAVISKWMLEGKTMRWMSDNLHIETKAKYSLSQSQIWQDVVIIKRGFREARQDSLDEALDKLEVLEAENYDAYNELKNSGKTHAFRYMENVINILKEKHKLLGFHHEEPKVPDTKLEVSITFVEPE
jgi:precorrin isomerase